MKREEAARADQTFTLTHRLKATKRHFGKEIRERVVFSEASRPEGGAGVRYAD
jgi:hypothetical protein